MDLFGHLNGSRSISTFWYVSDICFHPMFLTIFLRQILLGLISQLLIKTRVWDMNQGRFPIIFHQIMWMRKSSGKFLSRALCLITNKGDLKTHGDNHHLTQGLPFLYLPPMLKLDFGLWARVPQRFFSTLSPRSHFPTGQRFPTLARGHVMSTSRHVLSFLYLSPRSFFPLVSGFPLQITWPPHFQSLPVPVTSFPVMWLPLEPIILMVSGFRY